MIKVQLFLHRLVGTSYGNEPTTYGIRTLTRTWEYSIMAPNLSRAITLAEEYERSVRFAEDVGYHKSEYEYYPVTDVVVHKAEELHVVDLLDEEPFYEWLAKKKL